MEIIEVNGRAADVFIKKNFDFTDANQNDLEKLTEAEKRDYLTTTLKIELALLRNKLKSAYSQCESFWLGKDYGLDVGYKLTQQARNGAHIDFKNYASLNSEFIDLREFLETAEYVGRKIRHKEKTSESKAKGLEPDRTLLYKKDGTWIVFSKHSLLGEKYEILSMFNPENQDYEIYGEPTEEFRDQHELDAAIYKQLTDAKNKTL